MKGIGLMFKIRFSDKADFKIKISRILLLVFIAFLSCGFGSSKEENYIKSGDFGEGLKYVEKRLLKNQKDPSANYYAGRYLLAMNRQEEALPHLLQAVLLDVGKAKYHFWLGVSYWALRDFDKERKAYQRAIAIDFRYRSAHLYLGHNYFDSGEWNKALKQYEKVLELEKKHPDALFNRAVAIKELGRRQGASGDPGMEGISQILSGWKVGTEGRAQPEPSRGFQLQKLSPGSQESCSFQDCIRA
jgi:tetratricopeptide (TPR) repeat protein